MNFHITEEMYKAAKAKADAWDALVELAGTFMNGGGQTVSLIQDDATREYGVRVGDEPAYSWQRVRRTYWAGSFKSAVMRALEAEGSSQ